MKSKKSSSEIGNYRGRPARGVSAKFDDERKRSAGRLRFIREGGAQVGLDGLGLMADGMR